jgi:hypothetical protein
MISITLRNLTEKQSDAVRRQYGRMKGNVTIDVESSETQTSTMSNAERTAWHVTIGYALGFVCGAITVLLIIKNAGA